MATSMVLLYGLWSEFHFFLTRIVPIGALSLAVGLLVLGLAVPDAPIRDLVLVLMVPLMLFQALMRLLRALLDTEPSESGGMLFPRLAGLRAKIATALYLYGVVLATVAALLVVCWPLHARLGVDWPPGLLASVAVGHLVAGTLLIMTSVTLAQLFTTLGRRSHQSGRSLLASMVATYR